MTDRNHWDDYADAVEATVEGNRIISAAIGAAIEDALERVWQWLVSAADGMSVDHGRHLPPV